MFNLYSKFDFPTALRWWLVLVLICCAATSIHAQETTETKSVGENTLTGTQQTASGKLHDQTHPNGQPAQHAQIFPPPQGRDGTDLAIL